VSKIIDQYNRIKRWYKLFQEIDSGKIHDRDTDYYVDTIYAFFQNCHHLKDWIFHDNDGKFAKSDLNTFINNHEELKICGSLCNGSKHLVITNSHYDVNTRMGKKELKLSIGGSKSPRIKVKFEIVTSDKSYDAFGLATKCLEIWEKFLDDNNLILKST